MSGIAEFRRWREWLVTFVRIRKRVELTIQTENLVILHRGRRRRSWCRECNREVDLVGLSEAGTLAEGKGPLLRDSAERQGWHVVEDGDGALWICLDSALRSR